MYCWFLGCVLGIGLDCGGYWLGILVVDRLGRGCVVYCFVLGLVLVGGWYCVWCGFICWFWYICCVGCVVCVLGLCVWVLG